MKKFFTITLAAFAAASSFVSCDKEIEAPDTSENNAIETPVAGKMITITATLSDALTKVSFDPSFDSGSKPTGMSHTWEDGDKLRITDASNISNTKVFDLVSGAGTNSGTFSGEAIEASSYTVEVIPCGDYSEGNLQTQVKDGSTSHLKFVASATGVTDLSNINLSETSKIIGFIAKMPSGVSATINMLTIETSTDDFLTKTSLVVSLTNQEDVDTDGILKVYANVPASWSIPANTKMLLRFGSTNASHTVYTRYQEFASAVTINAGEFNYIKMNCSNIGQFAGKEDDGTAAHPYLIADGYQLQALNSLLGAKDAGTTVYSELVDNIDLSVYTNWTSIDASTRFINLEGNGKTISNLKQTSGSYPGLFYILYGTVKNFTISKANVSGGSGSAGILAGYLCSNTGASIGCTIDNVTIKESSLNGNGKVCGAIAGSVGQHASNTFAINISNVTVSGTTVETTNDCGGLIALTQGQTSTNRSLSISDCEIINSTVSSTGTGIRVGGVVGYARSLNTTISDIDVKGTNVSGLSKAKAVGGIVGLVESGVDFDKCTYEKNGTTTATVTGPTKHNNETDNASNDSDATLPGGAYVGGIAGEVSGSASFDDCHVKNATVTVTTPASNTGYWKNLGGAFGYVHNNNATIGATTACSVESTTVTGYHFAGGFVGFFDGGTISGAEVTGLSFSGWNYSGGFVGQMKSGLIEDSSVAGTSVTSANATVGGFAGRILGGTLDGNSTSLQVGTSSKKMTTNIGGFAGTI
ncbi:MAG: hypothetical protein J6X99_07480, partial [Bacteroidales bacterium]|nr:hypothetical protein [Bacteroidales bacterium]